MPRTRQEETRIFRGGGVTQRIWVTPEETIALSQAETSTLLIIGDDESAVHQVLSLATGP